jgi:deazaflavin-dependent oxidoreductase (nitroreductase family)
MSAYGKLLARLSRRAWFSNFAAVVLAPVDRFLWKVSGGRLSLLHVGSHTALPTLALTTTGRKSGKRRTTPVVYVDDGDKLFVMASNFGRGNHPAWSLNLRANPEAEVQLDGARRPMRAREASEEEKQRLWPRQLEVWPPWTDYRERTPREFRGFFLEQAQR